MSGAVPVLVLGATGAVGGCLVDRLSAAGVPVLAVSRRTPERAVPRVTWLQHDLDAGPAACETSVILGAGPLRHVRAQFEANPRAGRVVAVASAGVQYKQHSPDRGERGEARAAADEASALEALCHQRHAGLTLFRPTMIYGGNAPGTTDRLADLMRRVRWLPYCGRGLRQPVHADDLAGVMLAALRADVSGTFALGGGETLPWPDLVRRIAAASGLTPRLVRVPAVAASLALRLAWLAGRGRDLRPVMFRRQVMDLIVDDTPARERLAWAPRPFRP